MSSTNVNETVENDEHSSKFDTKDFNLAAFLWTIPGAALINCRKTQDDRTKKTILYFEFDLPISEIERHTLIINFFNKNCSVEPLTFISMQSKLKDLIHSQRI